MGVYANVHICIDRGQPLPVETRVAVVELAISTSSSPRSVWYRSRSKAIEVVNLYRSPDERSPHEPPDGVIGRFFDVIEVDAKRDFDARSAASSAFVKELKKLTGAKVICRTSWV